MSRSLTVLSLSIYLCLSGCSVEVKEGEQDEIRVKAPGVDIKVEDNNVSVTAPGVDVEVTEKEEATADDTESSASGQTGDPAGDAGERSEEEEKTDESAKARVKIEAPGADVDIEADGAGR
jgi:hypothetical protein